MLYSYYHIKCLCSISEWFSFFKLKNNVTMCEAQHLCEYIKISVILAAWTAGSLKLWWQLNCGHCDCRAVKQCAEIVISAVVLLQLCWPLAAMLAACSHAGGLLSCWLVYCCEAFWLLTCEKFRLGSHEASWLGVEMWKMLTVESAAL